MSADTKIGFFETFRTKRAARATEKADAAKASAEARARTTEAAVRQQYERLTQDPRYEVRPLGKTSDYPMEGRVGVIDPATNRVVAESITAGPHTTFSVPGRGWPFRRTPKVLAPVPRQSIGGVPVLLEPAPKPRVAVSTSRRG
jgi:hypothetical protein